MLCEMSKQLLRQILNFCVFQILCASLMMSQHVDGFDDLLRIVGSFVNDHGQITHMGRSIHWSTKGRIHSADELWVYDATAWDITSGTSVQVRHYDKSHEAKQAAIDKLILELKQRGIIKDIIHDTDEIPAVQPPNEQNKEDDGGMKLSPDAQNKDDDRRIREPSPDAETNNDDESMKPSPDAHGNNDDDKNIKSSLNDDKNNEIPAQNEHHRQDPPEDHGSSETVNVNNNIETGSEKKEIPKTGLFALLEDYVQFVSGVFVTFVIGLLAILGDGQFASGVLVTSIIGILVILVIQRQSFSKKVKHVKTNVKLNRAIGLNDDPDLDDFMEVEPDDVGLYTSCHVKAAKPTSQHLNVKENYPMCTPVKGLAYILNNSDFPHRPRNGSQLDFTNMKHLFTELGYCIVPHENLQSSEIRESIKTFVAKFNEPDAEYSSAVIVLMSHGDTGYIRGTDERDVFLKEIQREFEGNKCPKLQGRPKLFFIQACRGKMITTSSSTEMDIIEHDNSSTPSPSFETSEDDTLATDDNFAKDVPDNADMHFAYATTDGFLSLRSKVAGSWFIQVITEVFLAHAHEESLDNLMNKVTNRVSGLKGKLYDPQIGKKIVAKETPERVVRMRKTFYFLPKYPPTY